MATKPTKTRRAAARKRRKPAPSDKPKRHAWTRLEGDAGIKRQSGRTSK